MIDVRADSMPCPDLDRSQGCARSRTAASPASRCRSRNSSKLFDPPLEADTVRKLLDELRVRLVRRARSSSCRSRPAGAFRAASKSSRYLDRLAPEKPPRYSRAVMETTGDHRLPATRHPRRHRSHPRRRRVDERRQDARRPAMGRGRRPSRNAGTPGALRDDEDLPRRSRPALPRGAASSGRARSFPPPGDA